MQEDIENRAVALAIKSVKLTGHGLKVAIAKYLAHRKEQKLHTAPTGRQTVKQLMRQGQSVSNIEITDGNGGLRPAAGPTDRHGFLKHCPGSFPEWKAAVCSTAAHEYGGESPAHGCGLCRLSEDKP